MSHTDPVPSSENLEIKDIAGIRCIIFDLAELGPLVDDRQALTGWVAEKLDLFFNERLKIDDPETGIKECVLIVREDRIEKMKPKFSLFMELDRVMNELNNLKYGNGLQLPYWVVLPEPKGVFKNAIRAANETDHRIIHKQSILVESLAEAYDSIANWSSTF